MKTEKRFSTKSFSKFFDCGTCIYFEKLQVGTIFYQYDKNLHVGLHIKVSKREALLLGTSKKDEKMIYLFKKKFVVMLIPQDMLVLSEIKVKIQS